MFNIAEQEDPIAPACEPKPTTTEKIQAKIKVENVKPEEFKCETKHITESDQKVVCDGAQNDTEPNSIDAPENEACKVEEQNKNEIQPEERNVQQANSDGHVETAEKSAVVETKSSDSEIAESDAESQKEGQTNSSGNSDTTEEEGQKDMPSKQERRYINRLQAVPPFRGFRFPGTRKERRDCRQHIKK
jgi:hypothetical protein